jgi:hypothetical protein
MDWQSHVEYLIENRDDPIELKKYLDNLYNEIEGEKYDKERHYNDDLVKEDVDMLVTEWFKKYQHTYDSEENRKRWGEKLVGMIQWNRENKDGQRYEVFNGVRTYKGPYIGCDAFFEDTCSLYCYVLRRYYSSIGCSWNN